VPSWVVYGLATGRLENSFAVHIPFVALHLAPQLLNHGSTALVDGLVERNPTHVAHEAHAGDHSSEQSRWDLAYLHLVAENIVQTVENVFARGQFGSLEVSKADDDVHLVLLKLYLHFITVHYKIRVRIVLL